MIEQAAIKALQERHNYTVLNCMIEEPDTLPDGTRRKDKKQVVLPDVMLESLCRINPDIPEQTVRTVVDELCHTPVSGDLMQTNYQNYQKIRNGITVEYNKNGKKTSNILRLLSYNDALSNTFTVASQMWIKGETHWRRPDLIIFINGFPLVFIELKNSNIPVKNAYDINLKNYLKDIPYLFNYNQICVLSNGMETRLGSFATGYEFFGAYNFSWGLSRPMPLVGANNIVFKKCCSKDWGSTFCFFRLVIRYILQKSVFTKWRNNLERYYHKAP